MDPIYSDLYVVARLGRAGENRHVRSLPATVSRAVGDKPAASLPKSAFEGGTEIAGRQPKHWS
jgi:hypothetical protein